MNIVGHLFKCIKSQIGCTAVLLSVCSNLMILTMGQIDGNHFFFVVESFRIVSIRLSNREHSSPVTNSGLRIRVFTSNSLHHHREDDASIEAEQKFG